MSFLHSPKLKRASGSKPFKKHKLDCIIIGNLPKYIFSNEIVSSCISYFNGISACLSVLARLVSFPELLSIKIVISISTS